MRTLSFGLLLGALVGACLPAAHAETQLFNLNGNFNSFTDSCTSPDGCLTGSLSGTLAINTTTGLITGSALTVMNNGSTYNFASGPYFQQTDPNESCDHVDGGCFFTTYDAYFRLPKQQFDLYFETPTLVAYNGGLLCPEDAMCGSDDVVLRSLLEDGSGNFESYLTDGSSATPGPIVTTPEPSSLLLLGSGITGLAGVFRRRR